MNWLQQHKKTTWFSLSAAIAILIVAVVVYFHERGNKAAAQGDSAKQQQAQSLRVKVVQPREGGVERLVRRPGTVQSFEYADLYAKVSGPLENQTVDIGSRVKKGQLLAEVSAPEYAADVKKASADVNKAHANVKAASARVDKAKADVEVAQSEFEQSKADVTEAQAMKSLREKEYTRIKNLAASNSVTRELVDEKLEARKAAEATLFSKQKAVNTARSNITAAKARVEQANADRADAEAQIGVAQAFLERAKVFVGYTQIASPYTGVVTKRTFHNGDFIRGDIRSSSEPVLAVARTDKMRIIVQVPDRAVPYLKEGNAVTLTIDTLQNDTKSAQQGQEDNEHMQFTGTIARMAVSEAYDTRTMRTEVDLENPVDKEHPNGILTNGMYGEMTIQLGREKGLRIPSSCLFGNQKGDARSVYVVRDGKAHEVKVRIGIDDGIEVTIRAGLETSDRVVVERPSGLADKMPVEVLHDPSQSNKADKEEKKKATEPEETDKNSEKKDKDKGKKK